MRAHLQDKHRLSPGDFDLDSFRTASSRPDHRNAIPIALDPAGFRVAFNSAMAIRQRVADCMEARHQSLRGAQGGATVPDTSVGPYTTNSLASVSALPIPPSTSLSSVPSHPNYHYPNHERQFLPIPNDARTFDVRSNVMAAFDASASGSPPAAASSHDHFHAGRPGPSSLTNTHTPRVPQVPSLMTLQPLAPQVWPVLDTQTGKYFYITQAELDSLGT